MRGGRETNLSIFFLFSFNIEKVLEMCSIFILILAFSILNLSVNVYANQPIARFKNRTIGILSESDAGVFISTEKVTILGDLEVKATNQTTNITQQVDSLIRLQSNMELRVNTFAQHANMGVVCDPEGTEYRARNFENDEFGACICREGYMGETCSITDFETCDVIKIHNDELQPLDWISLGLCSSAESYKPMQVNFVGSDLFGESVHSFLIVRHNKEDVINTNVHKYVVAYQANNNYCYMTSFEIKFTGSECFYRQLESRKNNADSWSYTSTCNGKNSEDLINMQWENSNAIMSKIASNSSGSGFGIGNILFTKCSDMYDKLCPLFLKKALVGTNSIDIGYCNSIDDVDFVRAYLQGSSMWPRLPTTGYFFNHISTNSSSTFLIAHQSHDNWCKMIQMRLWRDESSQICSVKLVSAGYVYSSFSASTCYTEEEVVGNWDSKNPSSLALAQTGSGYGVQSIDFKICSI